MRKSTLLWLTLAAACGAVLFHTSQKVHDGRERLAVLNAAIAKEEESMRVLTAEWGYLNQPARLEKLARQYLKLAPLKGHQFVKADDLPLRPAPVAPTAVSEAAPEIIAEKAPAKIPEKTAVKTEPKAPAAPPVKIIKPAAATLPKPHQPPATEAAGASRSFSDLMRSLRHD